MLQRLAWPSYHRFNATGMDYHLKKSASQAIDKGIVIDESGLDIDGEPHLKGLPDLGADER